MKTSLCLLTTTVVIGLAMLVLIWGFPPNGDFGVENPFWNGLTTVESQENTTPLKAFNELPVNPLGTTLFLVPYEPFSEAELRQLKSYVNDGGTLVVMDDYGYGNQVLGDLGVNMKFTGEPLLDPLFDYQNKWFPKITDFTQSPMTNNVSNIILNHATSLNNTADAIVVAYSSTFSFSGTNGNEEWNTNESNGPLPVVAYQRINQGVVIAVADPSMLTNGMIKMGDNSQFIQNVASFQDEKPQVFVDQTHLPKTALEEAKKSLSEVYGAVSNPLATLTLIAVALAIALRPIWWRKEKLGRKL
ncbi:MAG: DUF4350 domain-containing protein [Candidatus Bathyarchaeia archaeon]|jgi:hypothetical protein